VTPSTLGTVVVALDGSPLAESALPLASAVARGVGAVLHLVRVVEPFWRSAYATIAPEAIYLGEAQVAGLEERAESDARAYLDQLAGALRDDGLRVVWETRYGRPAEELARADETSDAGLVVMATHGRGGLSRWALGSVTSELLQRGVAPLMVVRPSAAQQPAERGTHARHSSERVVSIAP
jgi:nucleotide-binding universal stress UspA family protein